MPQWHNVHKTYYRRGRANRFTLRCYYSLLIYAFFLSIFRRAIFFVSILVYGRAVHPINI